MNYPVPVFVFSFIALWLAERIGAALRKRRRLQENARDDFTLILTSALTLLGLIIGFTFTMAVSRYDQRKLYEEAEANAIGTEYVRADLLPADDAAKARALLAGYLDQRVLFYKARDENQIRQVDVTTAQLQRDLWSAAQVPAMAHPS